jgi:GntR family transcriptional regulator
MKRDDSSDALDHKSAIPLYFQLQEVLKERIELGAWQPGKPIPSETELCETFGVSRTVIRQALAVLEQDGQISRSQGRRSIVLPPKIEPRAGGISRLLITRNADVQITALSAARQQAPKRISDQLGLAAKDAVFRVMSLVRLQGTPISLFDSYFPVRAGASLADALPETLPADIPSDFVFRPELGRTKVSIETSFCSKWEAEQLQIPYHGAVFVTFATESRVIRSNETPFEVARGVYRADRVQFRLELAEDEGLPEARWQFRSK